MLLLRCTQEASDPVEWMRKDLAGRQAQGDGWREEGTMERRVKSSLVEMKRQHKSRPAMQPTCRRRNEVKKWVCVLCESVCRERIYITSNNGNGSGEEWVC
jgi:hypothetical protein